MILHRRKKSPGCRSCVNSAALGSYDKNWIAARAGPALGEPGMKRRCNIASRFRLRFFRLTFNAASPGPNNPCREHSNGDKR